MSSPNGWSEVGDGVFRICVADVNCYLVRTAEGLTLFDAGLPRSSRPLAEVLGHLGARPSDIDALVLTHGHFDHVGMARALSERGAPVVVHPRDAALARHPYRYRPASPRLPYLLSHPRGTPVITRMALHGALGVRGVDAQARVFDRQPLDVPGRPLALWTPGHTDGHCAYFFENSGVLLTGDALVTLDPYTGREGPQIVATAATADADEALRSLEVLEETAATLSLPGHGMPSTAGIRLDVARARRLGAH